MMVCSLPHLYYLVLLALKKVSGQKMFRDLIMHKQLL